MQVFGIYLRLLELLFVLHLLSLFVCCIVKLFKELWQKMTSRVDKLMKRSAPQDISFGKKKSPVKKVAER